MERKGKRHKGRDEKGEKKKKGSVRGWEGKRVGMEKNRNRNG